VDEEIVNIQPQELLDNDHYLRDAIGDLEQDLIDHETDVSNPHNVTHAQTGPEGATSGTDTAKNKHVSDADYKRWEDHLANKSNPHEVTAAQIGAPTTGDFQSHTNDKSNPHAVTAAQVGAPTMSAFQSHTNNKSNPHAVTAAQVGAAPASHTHTASQVGLGNVQNYGIATQAQAQAGTANNVYMTPLRVKEAITALAPLVPLQAVTSDPSSPAVGRIWLRTDLV
jgi:hypothetical protein